MFGWFPLAMAADDFPFRDATPRPSLWETWPFSQGGNETLLFSVTKGLFLLAIFAVIIWVVRRLFGPGGPMAEPWMRESWEAQRREKLALLEERLAAGEVSPDEYERLRKKLEAQANKNNPSNT